MEFTSESAQYVRAELGTALDPAPEAVKIKAHAPGYSDDRRGASHWVSVPRQIFCQMISMVRGEGEDKPLPHTFMGGLVVMSARSKTSKGTAPHQGVIIREYEDDGRARYSVHYIHAHSITDSWDGERGDYGMSKEEAFDEFVERCYRRHIVSRNRA